MTQFSKLEKYLEVDVLTYLEGKNIISVNLKKITFLINDFIKIMFP